MSNLLSAIGDAFNVMRDFFSKAIGTSGITILVCLLSVFALLLLWWLIKPAINKPKFVIKWWRLILLIVDVILLVYFCLMY